MMANLSDGEQNNFFGDNTTGDYNTFVGYDAGLSISTYESGHSMDGIVAGHSLKPESKIRCEHCGRKNKAEREVCASCGAIL